AAILRGSDIVSRKTDGDTADAPRQHGTDIAAILVGRDDGGFSGIVPDANLYAAGVFRSSEKGESKAKLESILIGLDWLLAQQIRVLNLSIAGPRHSLLEKSMATTREKEVIVVAAAGNNGPLSAPAYPAAYANVIAVTAIDQNRRPYVRANQGEYIALAAPGVNLAIPGPAGKMRRISGTSYSAAIVTGVVAEILRDRPNAKEADVMATLRKAAVDLGRSGRDTVFGWGLAQYKPTCGRTAKTAKN
ncbi:MAG: S8 family serine peptidase, partial [Pseudomonadota bacterium]